MIEEWAKILNIESRLIYSFIAILIIYLVYSFNEKAGFILGVLAIMALIANAKKGVTQK